jgi:hypothetical protein
MLDKQNQAISGSNNNQAGGDLVVFQAPPVNPLSTYLKELEYDGPDSEELIAIATELETYYGNRDVIGLEIKLTNANRHDLLDDAMFEKHRITQKLMKQQLSLQLKRIYHQVLAMLVHRFRSGILPMIAAGCSHAEVDEAVMELVKEIHGYTAASAKTNLTETDIHAMVFFLTGNCHLRWTK